MCCKNLKNIFVYSNTTAEIERIKNSLPQHLRGICVAHPLYEQIEEIRENALNKIRREHIEPTAYHNQTRLFSSLSSISSSRLNHYYQEAQNKMLRKIIPEDQEDLASYQSELDVIVNLYLDMICDQGLVFEEKNTDGDESQVCTIS